MSFENFTPNYYSSLIKGQQQSILIDNLYFYVADGVTQNALANNNLKTIRDEQQILNQIIYGGKLSPTNTIAMIRSIPWQSGKVFGKYNSRDPDQVDKDFFCINSTGYIYKCIDNNKGAPSTQEPQTSIPGTFELSDGYIWHYMYKLTENQLADFSIDGYIPLIIDNAVTAAAVRGTVSTVEVTVPGVYNELAFGSVQQVVSNTILKISDSSHNLSGTYNGMGFFIESGPGQGEYYQINQYTANSAGRFVTINKPIVSTGLGSQYDIAPYIRIIGNGANATARAVMSGTGIDHIQVLNRGSNYTLGQASIQANSTYVANNAVLAVNLSPSKGHGGDPYQELYVSNLLLNMEMNNYTISNDLPVNDISFCRVGTLRGLMDETTLGLYSNTTFNNTFTAQVPPSFGVFQRGDIVVNAATGAPAAQVVYANTTHIIGVYQTPFLRFSMGNVLTNSQGTAQGTVIGITQPQIKLVVADVVSISNINTTQRDENSREILQMLVKVK